MSLASLSIARPTFITCLVILMLAVGTLAMQKMGVDLFPDVTFPIVVVNTAYPGAGPIEIESLVSRPLEDEMSTLAGLNRLSSVSSDGMSQVVAEFNMEVDVKHAEQQIRDRVSSARGKLPLDIKEPVIRRIDPADQPILQLALSQQPLSATVAGPGKSLNAEQEGAALFDLADQVVRPAFEQVNQVGLVEIIGGRKREIQVKLDRARLKARELSVSDVVRHLADAGENTPSGKLVRGDHELNFRTVGEFQSVREIEDSVMNFFGSEVPVAIKDLGVVVDTVEDETSRGFLNGKKALFLNIYRQSGANTLAVVDALKKRLARVQNDLNLKPEKPTITIVRDGSNWIRANVQDVKESIFLGVLLAVVVVFFFLGSGRSTIITGLALPNSLIGAFILMAAAGFTINIMTLLALSLSIGLLIDDAIVVRENIFRHLEMGKTPAKAALEGTAEVTLAVIATTLTVIAVFGPVGFLKGVVGQFFKQFGLTICFAMAISLFDALTIAPMLSAYFAAAPVKEGHLVSGPPAKSPPAPSLGISTLVTWLYEQTLGRLLAGFERFQVALEEGYERGLRRILRFPLSVLLTAFLLLCGSLYLGKFIPKTFLPPQDSGEFNVGLDLPPGTSLQGMTEVASSVDQQLRAVPEVLLTALTVGGKNGGSELATFYVKLIDQKLRKLNTSQVKEKIRGMLKTFGSANPQVKDFDAVGGGERPFLLNLISANQVELEQFALKVFQRLKTHPGLKDVDVNFRPGRPEFQIILDPKRALGLGVNAKLLGSELRAQIEGLTPAKFRAKGLEYDIRVRLEDSQRDLKVGFAKTLIPNLNHNFIRLSDVAKGVEAEVAATINRQDRARFIRILADIAPGAGMGNVMEDVDQLFKTEEMKLPAGMRYVFTGQAENFAELASSVVTAMGLGLLFIYLVLASLYESFVTPLTIMLALPLALCGCLVALYVTHESLNIFSMIGIIMLLGVATKNSILLIDYANQLLAQGMTREQALLKSGKTRLRPILMTTMALIAGTVPVAMGLNEASRQRTGMGIAIIGGLVSSTLLTLAVVPAAFSYFDRFRLWSKELLGRWLGGGASA